MSTTKFKVKIEIKNLDTPEMAVKLHSIITDFILNEIEILPESCDLQHNTESYEI